MPKEFSDLSVRSADNESRCKSKMTIFGCLFGHCIHVSPRSDVMYIRVVDGHGRFDRDEEQYGWLRECCRCNFSEIRDKDYDVVKHARKAANK